MHTFKKSLLGMMGTAIAAGMLAFMLLTSMAAGDIAINETNIRAVSKATCFTYDTAFYYTDKNLCSKSSFSGVWSTKSFKIVLQTVSEELLAHNSFSPVIENRMVSTTPGSYM